MGIDFRRRIADLCAASLLQLSSSFDGSFDGGLGALLAEYADLKRENDTLKRENEELRKRVFRLNEDLPGEEWRDIAGYEGLYQVSNFVRFKSFHRGICVIRVPNVTGNRYADICLSKNGVSKSFLVHRVVALTFVSNPDPTRKTDVHHINNNKHDNRPENLMWVTPEENLAFALQDTLCGKPHAGHRRFLDDEIRYIRENPDGLSQIRLAKKLGVSNSIISLIQRNKIYKDVK